MSIEGVVEKGSTGWTLDGPGTKVGFATRAVPAEKMSGVAPMSGAPRVGDLVLAEVLSVGKNKTLEVCNGVTMYLFEGDLIVGAFGNRYATDQFEGYVPEGPVERCDLLSVGGVCGELASRHDAVANPTRLRVIGAVQDHGGRPLNTRAFGLHSLAGGARKADTEVILVVGSSMNSGKTTTAGTVARSLNRKGFSVAAGKVTGTAAGKDGRYFQSCGAAPVLDFTSAGYPSTYMLAREELLGLYQTLLARLHATRPDYIVLEIADGILQRETLMLLESGEVTGGVDHVFFCAGDSLSVESGVRFVRELGLPLRATAGAVTQSELAVREAEEATGVPCIGTEGMMNGRLTEALAAGQQEAPEEAPVAGRDLVASAVDAVSGAVGRLPAGLAAGRSA